MPEQYPQLRPWLRHKMDCDSTAGYGEIDGVRLTPQKPCNCGLDAALASSPAPAGLMEAAANRAGFTFTVVGGVWELAPLSPAPAGLDVRERLANLLAENGIAVENVASMGNADQWLPDYELADRLISAGVTLRAATRPAEPVE
jgi:hypothetical protein